MTEEPATRAPHAPCAPHSPAEASGEGAAGPDASAGRTALRERLDAALRTVGLARNLAAYRDAVLPVVEEALAEAERQRDQAIAALTHHAAEAHRRKWAHDDRGDVLAFRALGNLGDEILASRDRILTALDADQPKEAP